jgi:hypothetical protein
MPDYYVTQNSQQMLYDFLKPGGAPDGSVIHLQKDIDILNPWTPIARGSLTIQGHGYSIGTEDWRLNNALFGASGTGTLSGLNFHDLTLWVSINDTTPADSYMGAFARRASNSNATNCVTCGYIKYYKAQVGGIFGGLDGGTVLRCQNRATTYGYEECGGMVGALTNGSIIECVNTATIYAAIASGVADSAGIVGQLYAGNCIDCRNYGAVSAVNPDVGHCGGIAGHVGGGSGASASSRKTIRITGNLCEAELDYGGSLGGIAGYVQCDAYYDVYIDDNRMTKDIHGSLSIVGGIVGYLALVANSTCRVSGNYCCSTEVTTASKNPATTTVANQANAAGGIVGALVMPASGATCKVTNNTAGLTKVAAERRAHRIIGTLVNGRPAPTMSGNYANPEMLLKGVNGTATVSISAPSVTAFTAATGPVSYGGDSGGVPYYDKVDCMLNTLDCGESNVNGQNPMCEQNQTVGPCSECVTAEDCQGTPRRAAYVPKRSCADVDAQD